VITGIVISEIRNSDVVPDAVGWRINKMAITEEEIEKYNANSKMLIDMIRNKFKKYGSISISRAEALEELGCKDLDEFHEKYQFGIWCRTSPHDGVNYHRKGDL
jgi:hypothetical protein